MTLSSIKGQNIKNILLIPVQLVVLPVLAIYFIISLLPVKAIYAFMDGFRFIGLKMYGPAIMRKPLKRMRAAFPEASDDELKLYLLKHFRCMAWFAAEFLKSMSPLRGLSGDCRIVNSDELRKHIDKNNILVCYCPHCYNYEQLTPVLSNMENCDFYLIYNSLGKYSLIEYLIRWKRSRHSCNVHLISTESIRELYRIAHTYKSGATGRTMVIGVLGDLKTNDKKYSITFLGKKRYIPVGGEKIGRNLGADFLYFSPSCTRRGAVQFTVHPIKPCKEESVPSITYRFHSMLEHDILENPHLWMLWHD